MQVKDMMIRVPVDAPVLGSTENPFHDMRLLIEAQITRITVDVLTGTASVLLELRQTPHLPATTGLLRITGLAQQNWVCTSAADEFTAWSITSTTIHRDTGEFQLTAHCLPAGALRLVGTGAEFVLLQATTLPSAPPDYRADARALIRFGIADEDTECEIVGVARSVELGRV